MSKGKGGSAHVPSHRGVKPIPVGASWPRLQGHLQQVAACCWHRSSSKFTSGRARSVPKQQNPKPAAMQGSACGHGNWQFQTRAKKKKKKHNKNPTLQTY